MGDYEILKELLPYNRVLNSPDAPEEKKQELHEQKDSLFYLELLQRILKLKKQLDRVYRNTYNPNLWDDEIEQIFSFYLSRDC